VGRSLPSEIFEILLGHTWEVGVSAARPIGEKTTSSQDYRLSPSLNSELLPSELEAGFQPRQDNSI